MNMKFPSFLLIALLALTACGSGDKKPASGQAAASAKDSVQTGAAASSFNSDEIMKADTTGYQKQIIDVKNFAELYKNIGSNRTLRITVPEIVLPAEYKAGDNINVKMSYGFSVTGVDNLRIIGAGKKPVRIIQPDPGSKVLEFKKSTNVSLENIVAGHAKKGGCAASVFSFIEDDDIFLKDCDLFGSGYEGIYAVKVSNLNCSATTIRDCSGEIMFLSDSKDMRFFNCTFKDNVKAAGQFNWADSRNIVLNKCSISGNSAYYDQPNVVYLFRLKEVKNACLKDCELNNNKAKAIVEHPEQLKQINSTAKGNSWQQNT
jgi:hypothetical protein